MSTNLLSIIRFFRLNLFPQIKNLLPRVFCHFRIFYRNKKKDTLSNDWDKSLEDLRSLGFSKLPSTILRPDITDYFSMLLKDKKYDDILKQFNDLCGHFPSAAYEVDMFGKSGVPLRVPLDKSIFCSDFLDNLHLMLSNYYNQSYWLRNEPHLALDVEKSRQIKDKTDHFHIDYAFHQTTLVVLLSDITDDSTTTEIIRSSHTYPHLLFELLYKNKLRFSNLSKLITKQFIAKWGVNKLIGKAGDCFIFDPGNAFHRASWGTDRLMLHFTFCISSQHLTPGYREHLSKFGKLYTDNKLTAESLL